MEVSRFDMFGFMISLSKIAHQMWCNDQVGERNKTTERAVWVGVGGNRGGGGQNLKRGDKQCRGGLHKIRGLGPL